MSRSFLVSLSLLAAVPAAAPAAPDLAVAENGRYLVRDGKPFVWLGDTAWRLPEKLTREDVDFYLDDRKARGFTVVQVVAVMGEKSDVGRRRNPSNAYGHRVFHGGDTPDPAKPLAAEGGSPDEPNDYWDHLDYVVRAARRRGMILALLPCWGARHVNGRAEEGKAVIFDEDNARAFGAFLGARYGSEPHLVWVLGGDISPMWGPKKAAVDKRSVYRAMAEGLGRGATGKDLKWDGPHDGWGQLFMTYHPAGDALLGQSSSLWFHDDAWCDFHWVQTHRWVNAVHETVLRDWKLGRPKPTVMAEPAYEGINAEDGTADPPRPKLEPVDALRMRRQIWQSYLAGACGFTLGLDDDAATQSHGPVWDFTPTWKQLLGTAATLSVSEGARKILADHPWWQWQPDAGLVADGAGEKDLVCSAARTPDGREAMVYFPTNAAKTIDFRRLKGTSYLATWIHPQDGARTPAGRHTTDKPVAFQPPKTWPDALLEIRATAPPARGKLAPGRVSRLMTLGADGSDPRVIYETADHIEAPNWTPDGKWLVFNSGGLLWKIPAQGGAKPELIPTGKVKNANNDHVLSPDGRTIYLSAGGHVYAVPFEGGEPRRVSNEHPPGRNLRYYLHGISPDGKTLVYTGARAEGNDPWARVDVFTIPAAGGPDRNLTDSPAYDDGPEYSPDGRWIYFNSERDAKVPGHSQLYRMRPDGTGVEALTRDARVNWFPHPSPDGKWLVYLSYPPGTTGHPADKAVVLRRMKPDGSDARDLFAFNGGQGSINVPSWSPDSRRFAFVSYPATRLGIEGERFTVNDRPTFLLGISYYGALGAPEEFWRQDLDDMQRHGFNWLRVWVNWAGWSDATDCLAFGADGGPREPYFGRLKALVAECDRRGLVVDVTFSPHPSRDRPDGERFAAYRRSLEAVVAALRGYRNWYLDVGNEGNVGGPKGLPPAEARKLLVRAKELDPGLPVTASLWEDPTEKQIAEYVKTVGVDFFAPHCDRTPAAQKGREATTRALIGALRKLDRPVPLNYQEPLRRDFDYKKEKWQPTGEDILADWRASERGGAAAWCFHNGKNDFAADRKPWRSFHLKEVRLFDQFDAEERKVLDAIRRERGSP